ncbi:hypothetical protein H0H87_004538 [Tephrocybe sp. NHM501043]|nr:hypothetical protein H0H87_004538 [Tephrocybe sp. NHM501043]
MPSQESVGSSNEAGPSLHVHRSIDASAKPSSGAAKTSPARRTSALNPHNPSASRRRVRSAETADVFQDSPLERGFEAADGDNIGHNILSDEYNLSHEDPRILQDVQRALKLKARREARLSNQSTPPRPEVASSRTQRSISLTMQPMSPVSLTSHKESFSSDIDFSPSTGAAFMHPVPASLDNGLTLDWSGLEDRHESRWKLTSTKRKEKEVLPPIASVLEQQETAYADKLGRLKSIATPQTLKKAKLTQDQLGRRYNLVYGMLTTGQTLNTAKVARWHSQQDATMRRALEKAEPFTWLKHLEKRGSTIERPFWHISALIAEEYLHARSRHDSMMTIPESSPLRESSYEPPESHSFIDSQLVPVTSRASSNRVLGPSLVRKLSVEDGLTFEPRVNSTTSLELEPTRSQESSFSSLPLGSSPNSPSSGRGRIREITALSMLSSGRQHRQDNRSFEQLLSEDSDRGELKTQLSPMASPDMNIQVISASDGSDNDVPNGAGITLQFTAPTPSDADAPKPQTTHPNPKRSRPVLSNRRGMRVSLPSADRTSKSSEVQQQEEADAEMAHEAKLRLLEKTTTTNHRIRQLLNRVSGGIREYDAVQSNAMATLGIAHIGLPRDLIDAFGHDPAAVTGATRRFQGWRAVDDIQYRLLRQREVFRAFLSRAQTEVPHTKSVLDEPISSLVQSLKVLEAHSQRIAGRAFEVGEALKTVQATHDAVKTDYNTTLSRTSVVYPELSRIVALEESYKDQYQQFWEFGMDTLTFILDTVTPFWRSYGKPIGEDIRDFLIIPLYRNEFTGESKRYPITQMPVRSLRHWLGLQ